MKNSRRTFIAIVFSAVSALIARGGAASADTKSAAPTPTATPTPTSAPSPSPKPSPVARTMAQWVQRFLPKAKLSDELTEKIAGDIESGFDISKAFRGGRLENWDEPDFTFYASGGRRS